METQNRQCSARFMRFQFCIRRNPDAELKNNFLKIRSGMLADWAYEICRKFFSLIFVSADPAAPDCFALLFLRRSLWFGLDVILVIRVCGRRNVAENLHVVYRSDKQSMGAKVKRLFYGGADEAVGAFRHIINSVRAALYGRKAGKFVAVPPGLEAEAFKKREIGGFAENGEIKFPFSQNQIMSIISLINGNADSVGNGGYLTCRVDNTAIVFLSLPGSQDKKSVGQLKHGFFVHMASFFNVGRKEIERRRAPAHV